MKKKISHKLAKKAIVCNTYIPNTDNNLCMKHVEKPTIRSFPCETLC